MLYRIATGIRERSEELAQLQRLDNGKPIKECRALVASAAGPWKAAPAATVVGHVHLQVGAVPEAEAFYSGKLGFDVTTHYPGAAFYGSGGYHHHLATNVWNSRGAGLRRMPSTGLADVEILADAASMARLETLALQDPWGTQISLKAKAV